MLTVEKIEAWRKAEGLSCKELAGILRVNYQHFAAVLRGLRPLTEKLAALVEREMARRENGLKVAVLPQYEPLLRGWADAAGISVEQLVQDLLAEALKARLSPTKGTQPEG